MARGQRLHHTRHRNNTAAGLMVDRATKDIGAPEAAQGTMDRGHPLQDGAAAGQPSPDPEQGAQATSWS